MYTNSIKSGVTVLEIVIVISLFILSVFVVMSFLIQTYQANRFTDEQNEAINQAKKGINTMLKEIREALPADNGDYPIHNAQNQSFTFYGDIDIDGAVEKVRYFLDGTDLKRGMIEPSGLPVTYNPADEQLSIVSKYVRNGASPIFYYYNGNWPGDSVNNPLPTPADTDQIKLIRLYLKINYNPMLAPDDFILETNVQIRNLKNNL